MQIIQGIRDKGAAIIIIVIALSLIGFILMDASSGSSNQLFSGSSTTVGKVNGEEIELNEFNKRVRFAEEKQASQTGQQVTGAEALLLRDNTWQQTVIEKVFYKEAEKLGIKMTPKEFDALIKSNDPANPLMQEPGMTTNGQLDMSKVSEAIAQIKKSEGESRERIDARLIEPAKLSSAAQKYSALMSASAYYPTWMQKKDNEDAQKFATISYAAIPYTDISDAEVKVTDADIDAYVGKRKSMFKQEAGRSISFVTFSQSPSAADSNATKNLVSGLRDQFAADTNAKSFVAKNASSIEYDDKLMPGSKLTSSVKDTLIKLPQGTVYGPYVDGKNIVLAKIMEVKSMPDSMKARHILIPTVDPQTQQQVMSDSAAKKVADSVYNAIKGGADFAALAAKYSSDGSKDKGGDLGTYGYGAMVPEFNEFTWTKPVGSTDVVRTQFGYHIINVTGQSNFNPAYKIAYVAKELYPSDETINSATRAATQASNNKTTADLKKYAEKNGLSMTELPGIIKENDYQFGDFRDARQVVQWVFKADRGDVSEPISVGDRFIVATVTGIYKEGTQTAAMARQGAEAAVRNEKKAEMIKAKLGANTTVEAAAAAYNKAVLTAGADSTLTMAGQIIQGIGPEPKVIGAAFNKNYIGKNSPVIAGNAGVYVIRVNAVSDKSAPTAEQAAAQKTARFAQIKQAVNGWFEPLRTQAEVKDSRSKFF